MDKTQEWIDKLPTDPQERTNALLEEVVRLNRDLRLGYRFLLGVASGFGTIVGATVVVAIAVAILQPLAHITPLTQQIEALTKALESSQKRP